ncbi:hypothetical protein G7Y89_g12376 [Cudoniella acicularis]|uniref:Uncharacterized protein n=1 Tax=Cudoniella acicularis TaxID=354080 RepID=A0A8H4VZ82_9HELO|nr:hypothetical protein G7Y89_g12376 [Cudoniella acicularis]
MPSNKRSSSPFKLYGSTDESDSPPRPSRKRTRIPRQTIKDESEELKAQIAELHEFIIEGVMFGKATPSIRKHLEGFAGAAEKYAYTIRSNILATVRRHHRNDKEPLGNQYPDMGISISNNWSIGVYTLFSKSWGLMKYFEEGQEFTTLEFGKLKAMISSEYATIESSKSQLAHPRSSVYAISNRLSTKMAKYTGDVLRISYLVGGLPLAFELALFLGQKSYIEMGAVCKRVISRPSDPPLDEVLLEIVQRLREEDPTFRPLSETKILQGEIEYLGQHEINSYFPRSYRRLYRWCPSVAQDLVAELYKKIKGKITTTYLAVQKRYDHCRLDSKCPDGNWLSKDMANFILQIEELSEKPEGLLLAIHLVIFLGEHSFTCDFGYWQEITDTRNFGIRASDGPADELLYALATRADETNIQSLEPKKLLTKMWKSIDYLAKHDISMYFVDSAGLMSWL